MERNFTGTVVRATGSWYDVLRDGEPVRCRIRGRLRLKGVRSTNPVVVGDEVRCEEDENGDAPSARVPNALETTGQAHYYDYDDPADWGLTGY